MAVCLETLKRLTQEIDKLNADRFLSEGQYCGAGSAHAFVEAHDEAVICWKKPGVDERLASGYPVWRIEHC